MEVAGNAAGLDLGKKTYEMWLIDPNGKVTRTGGKTDFEGLDNLCKKLNKDDVVAIEACNLAFRIERIIRDKVGCRVVILNPGRLAIISMSTRKTDKEDSMKLAKYLRSHDENEMPIVTPPSDEEWARRKLLSEYRSLKSQRTKEINRLHAIFEHNFSHINAKAKPMGLVKCTSSHSSVSSDLNDAFNNSEKLLFISFL